MSEATEALSLRETIARIDRTLDEAAKFRAEERKLSAEADKFRRERFLVLVATLGAIAALTPAVVRAIGAHG